MSVANTIERKLQEALSPDVLTITDDSAHHAGHAGARPGGETHFTVEIVAAAFDGMGRVARQRLVYKVLEEELAGPVHALSIDAKAPGE